VVQFLSEEVAETPLSKRNGSVVFSGGSEAAKRRRGLLSSLQSNACALLSLLINAVSVYMQSSISQTSQGNTIAAEKDQSAVRASLDALAALASWLPLKVLKDSQLLDVCTSLLQSPPLQGHAVEVLTQVLQLLFCSLCGSSCADMLLCACSLADCGTRSPSSVCFLGQWAVVCADLQPEQQTSK
jgi:Exportin 1-like protein